jgi:hypothetical protein
MGMSDLRDKVAELEVRLATVEGVMQRQQTPGGVQPAADSLLDSEYGDPKVFKDPPRWTGASQVGIPLSRCPAAFLQEYANFKIWCLGKSKEKGDEKGMKYASMDASKALGWLRRIKEGTIKVNHATPSSEFLDDAPEDGDTPF